MGRRKYVAFLFESFNVKFNGFLNQLQYFLAGLSGGNAAWKIRNVGSKTCWAFFNYNQITHNETPISSNPLASGHCSAYPPEHPR